jgi:hypothetical protein
VGNRIRYYTDEHVARAEIKSFLQRGVDVLTISEVNLFGASDKDHLHRAETEARVLFTQDEDFLRLHAARAKHAGIAYASQGASLVARGKSPGTRECSVPPSVAGVNSGPKSVLVSNARHGDRALRDFCHGLLGEIVRGLMLIHNLLEPDDMKGHLEYL